MPEREGVSERERGSLTKRKRERGRSSKTIINRSEKTMAFHSLSLLQRTMSLRGGSALIRSSGAYIAPSTSYGTLRSRTTLAAKTGPPIPSGVLRKWYEM